MKTQVVIKSLIKICPGKRHAWFDSSVGIIRKPVNPVITSTVI